MLSNKLHLLICSIAFSSVALADDYASPAVFVPVSAGNGNVHEEAFGKPMSCAQALEYARFIRELSRSDGDANPELPYVACERENLAASPVEAD
jgi:hypothetical protein